MRRIALLLATLALAACSAEPAPVASSSATSTPATATAPASPLAQLSSFTVTDLQNADKIAVANGDTLGHACYPALIQFIQSLPAASTGGTVSGAISAFETARAARLKLQGVVAAGLPDYLKLGCSPLVLDEQTLLVKLGALSAGAAALAPVVPAIASGALP